MNKNKEKINFIDKIALVSIWLQSIVIATGNNNKIIIIAVLLIQMFYIGMKLKKKNIILSIKQRKLFVFIIAIYPVILLMSGIGNYSEETIVTTTLIFGMTLCTILIAWSDTNDNKNTYILFKGLLVFFIFLALYGIIIRFFGSEPKMYNINGTFQSRQVLKLGPIQLSQRTMGTSNSNYGVSSLTQNPNSLSYYLLYAFIINTGLINIKKVKCESCIINYICYPILILGIFIAGSRLAILLLPITYLLSKLFYIKKSKMKNLILLILIAIMLIISIFIVINVNVLENIDFNGREVLWSAVPEIINSHMLLGERVGSISFCFRRNFKC